MRIAVISARYGLDVGGGAETLARGLLEEIVKRGHYAEVWTSCARNHQTWQNTYPAGQDELNGVLVRRFNVDKWQPQAHHELSAKLVKRGRLSVEEQYAWIESGPTSIGLYAHAANYAADYDVVVVIPVINTLIYQAAVLLTDNLVLWPCLHDEVFAYLEPFRLLMETARGNIFNSPEEFALASRRLVLRLQRTAVIGSGVALQNLDRVHATGQTPYLLYIGRLEEGKNLPLLTEFVQRYAAEGYDLKLLAAGSGTFMFPNNPAFENRGFVSELEKANLYAGALALCQPSVNESFSLTMMESWLAGRPSLVHAHCAVTRGHVKRARGGLWFETYGEFRGALNWFQRNSQLARRMGQNGRKYVQNNYTWPVVADRFLATMQQWRQET